jgi:hypothetical protein
MSRIIASAGVPNKVDQTSYTPRASLPLMPPITPSQLAAEIKALLVSSQELGRRQDALMASISSAPSEPSTKAPTDSPANADGHFIT